MFITGSGRRRFFLGNCGNVVKVTLLNRKRRMLQKRKKDTNSLCHKESSKDQ